MFVRLKFIVADYCKKVLTARNNRDWSATKLIVLMGSGVMMFEFVYSHSQEYLQLGLGLSALIAALAGKYFVENSNSDEEPRTGGGTDHDHPRIDKDA
jgi:hypothetical protein